MIVQQLSWFPFIGFADQLYIKQNHSNFIISRQKYNFHMILINLVLNNALFNL